jgi:hypothetical protein
MRSLTTLVLASAFVGGSISIAAAQSTSSNWMNQPSVSPATHCLDRVTQQPQLKSAAAPSGSASGSTTGSGTASSSGSPSGSSSGMSGGASGGASGSASSAGAAAGLQPCP